MDCKQETIFTLSLVAKGQGFTFFTLSLVAKGQGFTFGIVAANRAAACKDLREKLVIMVNELESELSAKAAN
jgi:hypothetical protein